MTEQEMEMMWLLRKAFSSVGTAETTDILIDRIMHTKSMPS